MTTLIPIDRKVPLPKPQRGPRAKYPFRTMKKGDSFLVSSKARNEFNVRCASYMASRRLKVKFTVRRVPEGIRVWRIA